jgi:D-alanyl-D-alanine dipeptidase
MLHTGVSEAKSIVKAEKKPAKAAWRKHMVDVSELEKSRKIPFRKRIRSQLAYFTEANFVGKRIDGYLANKCLLSRKAATALLTAQAFLLKKGYSLILFDCYRPQKAVDHFVRWCGDSSDLRTKPLYYPAIATKQDLLKLEYIASKSGHSRGSTVDLGLVRLKDEELVDMGTAFDFFGEESHTLSPKVSVEQRKNRGILLRAMEKARFMNYEKEWWHYTLRKEPYPKSYFDYDIE